jgi:hypothetical protein
MAVITDIQAQHYLFEIARESELAERLFERFQRAAETWLEIEHTEDRDGRTLWTGIEAERTMEEALEGLLSSYARVSLFFFPERSSKQFALERGKRLRELVGVDEDHPLANRELRNHWMHHDHRFDTFVQHHGNAPLGYYLGSGHRVSDATKAETLRLVDPGTETVFVLGKEYKLRIISDAVGYVGQQSALAITSLVDGDA